MYIVISSKGYVPAGIFHIFLNRWLFKLAVSFLYIWTRLNRKLYLLANVLFYYVSYSRDFMINPILANIKASIFRV